VNYWVICITEDNLHIALRERVLGFRESLYTYSRLKAFSLGDAITFYVPRASLSKQTPVRKFFAHATIASEPYRSSKHIWSEELFPVRMDLEPVSSGSCDIKPLISKLTFIQNKKNWGGTFMSGRIKISKEDFALIQDAIHTETLS
jgi:predicted RNA-binding protein